MAEMLQMQTNLMLNVIIGEDIGYMEVDLFQNGVKTQVTIGYALLKIFENLLLRMLSIHLVFFPSLANKLWFTPYERECHRNATNIRNVIRGILIERKS